MANIIMAHSPMPSAACACNTRGNDVCAEVIYTSRSVSPFPFLTPCMITKLEQSRFNTYVLPVKAQTKQAYALVAKRSAKDIGKNSGCIAGGMHGG